MDYLTIATAILGFLMSLAFIPQAAIIAIRKKARDVSMYTLGIFLAGSMIWTIYGIREKSAEIILMNGIMFTTVTITTILWLVFNSGRNRFYRERVFLD